MTLVVIAGERAFYPESMSLNGASIWLTWLVTGDNDQECPAANQDEQECGAQPGQEFCSGSSK